MIYYNGLFYIILGIGILVFVFLNYKSGELFFLGGVDSVVPTLLTKKESGIFFYIPLIFVSIIGLISIFFGISLII
jgi:hypothetical protein